MKEERRRRCIRTACRKGLNKDSRVRPAHQKLNGITLPPSHAFWDSYYPPNGWNCRCNAIQVLKDKYERTPDDEVYSRANGALTDKEDMFKFNSGKQEKAVPDYNPYTIRQCTTCPIAIDDGTSQLKKVQLPQNQLCEACRFLRTCNRRKEEYTAYGKGGIYVSKLVNPAASDYNDLMTVARYFAKEGSTVHLLPSMSRPSTFDRECYFPGLDGTKYANKCPDLLIDGKYYEVEGFNPSTKPENALRNMLRHGKDQSNNLIIKRPGMLEDNDILQFVHDKIENHHYDIKDLWIKEENGECTHLPL